MAQKDVIPKTLFMYWHQGWDNAPYMVRRCCETWIKHNPNWNIHMMDAENIEEKIIVPSVAKKLRLPLPALSDVLRICLLQKWGGVWVDATLWCVKPLDDWLESVRNPSRFFAYHKPAPDRPVASWFLVAGRDCRIVDMWHEATLRLLIKTRRSRVCDRMFPGRENSKVFEHSFRLCQKVMLRRFYESDISIPKSDNLRDKDYFWFHKIFKENLNHNDEFRDLWGHVPKINAEGPHFLQQAGLLKPVSDDVRFHIENRCSSVYKLTHRKRLPDDISGTVLGFLYRSSNFG